MFKKIIVLLFVITVAMAGCASTEGMNENDTQKEEIQFDGKTLLPLGSVVLLKGGNKKIMICGRVQSMADDETIYDYSACYYPEGIIDPKEMFLFNNENIEQVYFKGYEDEEELTFRDYAQEKMEGLRGE